MSQLLKTQGFVLLDVDVAALNNAGKSTDSNYDNAVATKKIKKNERVYVYVSGQAWRYWWRETLKQNFEWKISPITKESKIAFTAADPIEYDDDDMFGYMKAAKDTIRDEAGNPVLDKKGKEQTENVTVTRISPLKNSALISVASTKPEENWSSMARQEGDSVPYVKEEYSAILKGMFSIDLFQAGTFADYNKTGFKNLTEELKTKALYRGGETIEDKFVVDSKGKPQNLVRVPREIRLKRIVDTVSALKTISGGAMQTNNLADVTPKFIILATTTSGNHPFSHVVKNEGRYNERAVLNIDGIREVLNDYRDQFAGKVFIGKRSGFLDEYNEELAGLLNEFPDLLAYGSEANNDPVLQHNGKRILSINQAIDAYCEQVKEQV